ncbi:hypothetical protein [Coleofasciculus sp. FACHB-1120]|uniref:hypothetical protein n=1 Tax=Coleofasciculus sp. FACHB-1120 TaxID=2692783 RepID=UPI0016859A35|nr:hypothetical protein [Coleofasciculus sp. FACHB-1120]MBD2744171.1 hypothetical protein [Coleofasciculus sp. FACHB-1120]
MCKFGAFLSSKNLGENRDRYPILQEPAIALGFHDTHPLKNIDRVQVTQGRKLSLGRKLC